MLSLLDVSRDDVSTKLSSKSASTMTLQQEIEMTVGHIPDIGDQSKNLMKLMLQSNFEGNHFFINESTDTKLDLYFNRLDKDGNNCLNANDFTSNVPQAYEEKQKLWRDLSSSMDYDNDGKISKVEFYCFFIYDALQKNQGNSVNSGRFVADLMSMRDQLNNEINLLADQRYNAISRLL